MPPSAMADSADWIAVDWGTSRLRAWAMTRKGEPVAAQTSDRGMRGLAPDSFEPALLSLIDPWLGGRTEIVACGMAGASQGWVHAPYSPVPCAPVGAPPVAAPARDARLAVRVVPGLSQESPADVMRGEETQIAGMLAREPGFDGVLCLPGSHTKWARISAGEVVSFRTFMSGELFDALGTHTVLRHTLADGAADEAAFAEAVARVMSRPETIAAEFFALRAEALLRDLPGTAARARLSGLLIGAELAAARPYWLGERVAILGEGELAQSYAAALRAQGLDPALIDATTATLAGLTAARDVAHTQSF